MPPFVTLSRDDFSAKEGDEIQVRATAVDSDGEIDTYEWTQLSGPSVDITYQQENELAFRLPDVDFNTKIVMQVRVLDDQGAEDSKHVVISVINSDYSKPIIDPSLVNDTEWNQFVPGMTPGELSIDQNGTANYSIPLIVPPGSGGMKPDLSLNYSSKNKNPSGMIGVGWSLGGLSVITRCPATKAQDGFIGSINFDENDRYCLDGQRLIAINGADGDEETEYRTEIDTYSKVLSVGSPQYKKGPKSWIVYTKSGQVMYYGSSANSRINSYAFGTPIHYWSLDKVEDAVGNYLTITYAENESLGKGAHFPISIDYTGNDNEGLLPYARVTFEYEDKPKKIRQYTAGTWVEVKSRLNRIHTFSNDIPVKTYKLKYEPNTLTGASNLIEVQECASDDSCFSPIQFSWADKAHGFKSATRWWTGQNQHFSKPEYRIGYDTLGLMEDYNGDGLPDRVFYQNHEGKSGLYVALNTGEGFGEEVDWNKGRTDYNQHYPVEADSSGILFYSIDMTGDGLPDRVGYRSFEDHSPGMYVMINNGSGFNPEKLWWEGDTPASNRPVWRNGNSTRAQLIDMNGDGLPDRISISSINGKPQGFWVSLNNGSGFDTEVNWWTKSLAGNQHYPESVDGSGIRYTLRDVNGDGLPDRIGIRDYDHNKDGVWVMINDQGQGFKAPQMLNGLNHLSASQLRPKWTSGGDLVSTMADINGDGLLDHIHHHNKFNDNHSTWVAFNTGVSFSSLYKWRHVGPAYNSYNRPVHTASGQTRAMLIDINNDQILDRVTNLSVGSNTVRNGLWVAFGNGSGVGEEFNYWPHGTSDNQHLPELISYGIQFGLMDMNGDGFPDRVAYKNPQDNSPNGLWVSLNAGNSQVINKITDSLGAVTTLEYQPLTNKSVYKKHNNATYPVVDIQNSMEVVASVATENGVGGTHVKRYEYTGAKQDLSGRGFLGFATMTATDESKGIRTITQYMQSFPFQGLIRKTIVQLTKDDTVIGLTESSYESIETHAGKRVYLPYAKILREQQHELDGSLVSVKTTETTIENNNYGYPSEVLVTLANSDESEIFTTISAHTYEHDEEQWHLGRVTRSEVTKEIPGGSSATRVSAFTYTDDGLLREEIVEPDSPELRLTTDYYYDGYGNILRKRLTAEGERPRSSYTYYDLNGQFPIETENAEFHQLIATWDASFGQRLTSTDPNGITVQDVYDGFGRKTAQVNEDGTVAVIHRFWCDGYRGESGFRDCPADAVWVQVNETTGAPLAVNFIDKFGRQIKTAAQGFDGQWIYEDTVYNADGLVVRNSRKYYDGDEPLWHQYDYDALGRRIKETSPDGSTTEIIFNGLETTTENSLGAENTRFRNVRGDIVESRDARNISVHFEYDPFGNLITVKNLFGVVTALEYDIRGRKTQMKDQDVGTLRYQYNAFGELIRQEDAKGQVSLITRDRLGRQLTRQENEGTSYWYYDLSDKGIGKLTAEFSAEGKVRYFEYDLLGRPHIETTSIDGKIYNIRKTFDDAGRVAELIYPTGYSVKHSYNGYGYLDSIRESATEALLWQAEELNAEGQITSLMLGNGLQTQRRFDDETGLLIGVQTHLGGLFDVQDYAYEYDELGNLLSREDLIGNHKETFIYDSINRLVNTDYDGHRTRIVYDDFGNITSKEGVGSYKYDGRPHAVSSIDGKEFAYDDNGNMVSGWDFDRKVSRSMKWTSYNKMASVTVGDRQLSFAYGADRLRFKQIDSEGKTRIYVGGIYEADIKEESVEHVHYIRAGNAVFAINKQTEKTTLKDVEKKILYLHKDHIGSITEISDADASVVEQYSYDAHGKRRSTVDWKELLFDLSPLETQRSFTGHEYLDGFGLIHMNGRVYDPTIGRFLSADPFVQEPGNSQSLNRYSYVLNNPLSAVDPSGYLFGFIKKFVKKIGRAFKRILSNPIVRSVVMIAAAFGGPAGVAVASGTITAIDGGSIGDVLKAASISFITAMAFSELHFVGGESPSFLSSGHLIKTVAHGTVGGLSSVASGGKFMSGFASGAFTQFMAPSISSVGTKLGRVVAASVAGGTASVLGGGKFANGAVTGAFSRLFNDENIQKSAAAKREKLAKLALISEGDTSYAFTVRNGRFAAEEWKCNQFVAEKLIEAGIDPVMLSEGSSEYMTANGWANRDHHIPGWEIVDTPLPGDVAAIPRSGRSGHVGIYVGDRGYFRSSVMAANEFSVGWSGSHLRNNYSNAWAGAKADTVYRRYVGK